MALPTFLFMHLVNSSCLLFPPLSFPRAFRSGLAVVIQQLVKRAIYCFLTNGNQYCFYTQFFFNQNQPNILQFQTPILTCMATRENHFSKGRLRLQVRLHTFEWQESRVKEIEIYIYMPLLLLHASFQTGGWLLLFAGRHSAALAPGILGEHFCSSARTNRRFG